MGQLMPAQMFSPPKVLSAEAASIGAFLQGLILRHHSRLTLSNRNWTVERRKGDCEAAPSPTGRTSHVWGNRSTDSG